LQLGDAVGDLLALLGGGGVATTERQRAQHKPAKRCLPTERQVHEPRAFGPLPSLWQGPSRLLALEPGPRPEIWTPVQVLLNCQGMTQKRPAAAAAAVT